MSDTRKVKICSDLLNGISRWVDAYIEDEYLQIEGQDLGSDVPGGDGEYEYFFSFNREETAKFSELLTGSKENLDIFLDAFAKLVRGSRWYFKFIEYCEENELHYTFFSY